MEKKWKVKIYTFPISLWGIMYSLKVIIHYNDNYREDHAGLHSYSSKLIYIIGANWKQTLLHELFEAVSFLQRTLYSSGDSSVPDMYIMDHPTMAIVCQLIGNELFDLYDFLSERFTQTSTGSLLHEKKKLKEDIKNGRCRVDTYYHWEDVPEEFQK